MIPLILTIVLIGVVVGLFWMVPVVPQEFKTLVLIVGVLWAVLIILEAFGLHTGLSAPRLR